MQEEHLVEPAVTDLSRLTVEMAILDVDLRGLGETGELLVRALRDQDAGRIRSQLLEPHAKPPAEQRVELHEAGPGLVEEQVVAKVADLVQ